MEELVFCFSLKNVFTFQAPVLCSNQKRQTVFDIIFVLYREAREETSIDASSASTKLREDYYIILTFKKGMRNLSLQNNPNYKMEDR